MERAEISPSALAHPMQTVRSANVLTRWPIVGALLRHGVLMTGLRSVSLALLLVAIGSGIVEEDARTGLSVLLMWGVFWPLFTCLVTPTLGNAFCALCPHGFLGKWLTRVGLRRAYPQRLRGVWGGLVIIVAAYWVVAYAMPGALAASTRVTAWYFLVFTLMACAVFFIFKDMAWCKHLCPLGRLLAAHGRVGMLQVATESGACASCRSFDCAKACSYHLSPFRFQARNNMESCTLCTDCVQACKDVHVVIRAPGHALRAPINGQDRSEVWVFLVILAVAGVGIQCLHGLQHTPLKPYLPWNIAGAWLHARIPLDPAVFDLGRLLTLLFGLAVTLVPGIWAYRRAAARVGRPWREVANQLAPALAPVAIVGLIPHAVMTFVTRNAHALGNELGRLGGWELQLLPLAQKGDVWLRWLEVLPFLGVAWALWLMWKRAGLLGVAGTARTAVWAYGSVPAGLYLSVMVLKVWAFAFMASTGHVH